MSSTSPTYIPAQIQTPDLESLWSRGIGDLKKTELAYMKAGIRYQKPPQQLSEEKWFTQVTNENTGEFLQPELLKALGLVTADYENNKKYPIKTLNSLIRLKTTDGKEWLLSRQYWTGLDRLGNEIPKAMEDKELYLKPVLGFGQSRRNSDPLSKPVKKTTVIDFTKECTLPFSAKDADRLYSLRRLGDKVSLVIKNDPDDPTPYSVSKYTDFRDRDFEDLYTWSSTPKFNLDRNVKDQLQDRQYG